LAAQKIQRSGICNASNAELSVMVLENRPESIKYLFVQTTKHPLKNTIKSHVLLETIYLIIQNLLKLPFQHLFYRSK
jgi:hypothetical protein